MRALFDKKLSRRKLVISAPTGTSVVSVWLASADRPRAEA